MHFSPCICVGDYIFSLCHCVLITGSLGFDVDCVSTGYMPHSAGAPMVPPRPLRGHWGTPNTSKFVCDP